MNQNLHQSPTLLRQASNRDLQGDISGKPGVGAPMMQKRSLLDDERLYLDYYLRALKRIRPR